MRHVTILQTPNGFFVSCENNLDLEKPPAITFANAIPAISLQKSYSDYSGKSVLEIVEKFFTEPLPETP